MFTEIPWDSRLGSVLGDAYRITRMIGEGGMGAVYEAVQLRLNKRVAVKLMSHQLTTNQTALARFRREAAITSRLGHPNLVSVIDFGTSQAGEPYMVMEYLDGEDLDQRLERCTTVPVDLAAHIIRQAASALGAVHAQGIVHRDLKPANIFLVDIPGEIVFVKVLDFGISKVKAAGSNLTKPAVALGTPFYISPEQAMGKTDEIDHPADQWALACIAWEMLCGHTPFVEEDVTALFFQILESKPESLLSSVPGLASEVELVLLRALSKSAKDRYPSIRDFASAFGEAVAGRTCDLSPSQVGPVTLCDPRVCDPRVCDPRTGSKTLCDPRVCDPRAGSKTLCDPRVCDPSLSRSTILDKSLTEVLNLSAEDEPESEESLSKPEVVFSRDTEEIVNKGLKKRWFRLDLRLVSVLFVLASALILDGIFFLRMPGRSPPARSSANTAAVLAVDAGSGSSTRPPTQRPPDFASPPPPSSPVNVPPRKKILPARKVRSIPSPSDSPHPSPENPATIPAEPRKILIREL